MPDIDGLSARVSGDRVLVEAPDKSLETSLQYTIRDARGATATAVLQITVDENVPLQAPVARDDRLRPADLKDGSLSADLDILNNDEDPDGTTDRLDLVRRRRRDCARERQGAGHRRPKSCSSSATRSPIRTTFSRRPSSSSPRWTGSVRR